MSVAVRSIPLPDASEHQTREPRLLVELPSWSRVFFRNLRDLIRPQKLPPLHLTSAPAPFWSDVFVARPAPWRHFLESVVYHVVAIGVLGSLAHLLARSEPTPSATFDRSQVIHYQPAEYLPPLNTLRADSRKSQKADPLPSAQQIISVPAEADNQRQTVVTPPSLKLKRDVALPNIVAWRERPVMPIAPAPLIPAASLMRLVPELENSVVAPPPDLRRSARPRELPQMKTSVVAPPPDPGSALSAAFQTPQAAVIEPPPNVEAMSTRPLGDLNVGRSAVIAPAPQLPVAEQRAVSGARRSAVRGQSQVAAPQVIPPPPSLTAGSGHGSAGSSISRTSLVALSPYPAVSAPPDPPPGNRRGNFAAGPVGRAGASGAPGSTSGNTVAGGDDGKGRQNGSGSNPKNNGKNNSGLPAGLFVGNPDQPNPSATGGDGSAEKKTGHDSVNPNLMASAQLPRVAAQPPSPLQPGNESKLSEAEHQVFGNRKFYSLTLNMPNLNSAGGSWVIRFAEMHGVSAGASSAPLSAPAALRKVDPAYPLQLMRQNVSGTVILYAVIHADGAVGNVRVLRGVDDRIDQFASQAVAQWQFEPATKNGTAVDVEATFQIPFRPGRGF